MFSDGDSEESSEEGGPTSDGIIAQADQSPAAPLLSEPDGLQPISAENIAKLTPVAVEMGLNNEDAEAPRFDQYEAISLTNSRCNSARSLPNPDEVIAAAMVEHQCHTPNLTKSGTCTDNPGADVAAYDPDELDALIDEELGYDPLGNALQLRHEDLLKVENEAKLRGAKVRQHQEQYEDEVKGAYLAEQMMSEFENELTAC